jgi:3-deoxy-manno-octulosonate cytidylyltransferase (CMP-KDO synthetase)
MPESSNMSHVLGVIPARYASERFPGKILADLGGRPMIRWVYESAKRCSLIDRLIIATDDERVLRAAEQFGAECMMTSKEHKTGTDRLVEVASSIHGFDTVVNIQGDEPGIEPDLIDGVIQMKKRGGELAMATAARPFHADEDIASPDRVKVVISKSGRALYFSRSPIPYVRNQIGQPIYLHLGIYAYDLPFLLGFRNMPRSGLEDTESLEQLRALENDYQIGVHVVSDSSPGVDTPGDLEAIKRLFIRKGMISV